MGIKEISPKIYNERQLKAVTGTSLKQFITLLEVFDKLIIAQKEKNKAGKIKPDNGNKGKLETSKEKLLFVLCYLKCYPTFDHLGFQFNMSGANAHTLFYGIAPIFLQSLMQLGVMPHTQFDTPEEMHRAFKKIGTLVIDVTERPVQRPQDYEIQEEHYSGKKKTHGQKHRHQLA